MDSPTHLQQNHINDIFNDLIISGNLDAYLDDLLIFLKNQEHHDRITLEVLKQLHDNDLYLKTQKCEFDKTEIEFVGL